MKLSVGTASFEALAIVLIAAVFLICLLGGLTRCGYLSNDRYVLIGCNKDVGICKRWDNWNGVLENIPLPTTPAERGEKEVKVERWAT